MLVSITRNTAPTVGLKYGHQADSRVILRAAGDGILLSIQSGKIVEAAWAGRLKRTAIDKWTVIGPVTVTTLGLVRIRANVERTQKELQR